MTPGSASRHLAGTRALVGRLNEGHRRLRADPERGTTLVEIMVGMLIMTICGAIFTSAIVSLSRTTNQAQAVTDGTDQNNRAFQTLDRTVRYASAISTPTLSGGSWYVELRTLTSGTEVCTQLRVNTADARLPLESRSWTVTGPTTSTGLTGWTPLASGITNGGVAGGSTNPPPPFILPSQNGAVRQRLQVTLVAQAGLASQRASTRSAFTLTAINSALPALTTPICTQVGRS